MQGHGLHLHDHLLLLDCVGTLSQAVGAVDVDLELRQGHGLHLRDQLLLILSANYSP